MYDERGSLWRKWDLHFHTPSSYDYENKALTNQEIVESLIAAGISVVAITDHHFIDVPRIMDLKRLGADKLTILPGIELRSELGGSESVHFIGIFPENCDIENIWIKLQGLNISPSDVLKRGGDDHVYVDLKEAAALIHSLDGIVSIHAGKKSNSIENIANTEFFKMALKSDLVTDSVDILEVGKVKDIESYEKIVFPKIGRCLPLIVCSDDHYATKYSTKTNCWVKADPCFRGLQQALIEPTDRFYVGDIPDKLKTVASRKTKYISGINIYKNSEANFDEIWFESDIPLNHELIAIIGNKGSGKSALADILGLLGNSKKQEWFPFLNTKQFRIPSEDKSRYFSAKAIWESGSSDVMGLDKDVDFNQIEKVKYIPQNFFEIICNRLEDDDESDFNKELQDVIFSHVDNAERLSCDSLAELLAYKTVEIENTNGILKDQLIRINKEIVEIESELTPEHRYSIENKLISKKEELKVHDSQEPQAVIKPSENDPKEKAVLAKLDENKQKHQELNNSLSKLIVDDGELAIQEADGEKVRDKLENFETQYQDLLSVYGQYLKTLGLKTTDVIKLKINKKVLNDKMAEISGKRAEIKSLLDESKQDSLRYKLISLEKEIEDLQKELSEKYEKYQAYERTLEEWKRKRSEIIGDEIQFETIKYYEHLLDEIDSLPQSLENKKARRIELVRNIFSNLDRIIKIYRKLAEPVQLAIDNHHLAKGKFSLNFDVSVVCSKFDVRFFEWVSHGASGTFYGTGDGKRTLEGIINKYDFNSVDDVVRFLSELLESLTQDKRHNNSVIKITDQFKKGKTVESFYDFIFSLDYLKPKYVLKMGDKELSQLSPGEKGALLLIFYLLVDKADVPLLIDQPEHNLDNQTVYDVLVPCIKYAKQKRQIILVTHNPNLAVVCDADQIICASIDKKNKNRVTYLSGGIENPVINQKIVDILEGTRPAFDNREAKYLKGAM